MISGPSSVVVVSRMPLAVKSVLPVTPPNPGKCLITVSTPESRMPSMNAVACSALPCASRPKSRYSAPIGAFEPRSTVTVPTTGARSTLMPAWLSCEPHTAADWRSASVLIAPWSTAVGIVSNPGPCRCWTRPPSWSVVISSRLSAGAYDCRTSVAWRTPAVPDHQLPMISTEPTCWLAIRSYRAEGSVPAYSGAMTSCPTRSSMLIASTARCALARGESSTGSGAGSLSASSCADACPSCPSAGAEAAGGVSGPAAPEGRSATHQRTAAVRTANTQTTASAAGQRRGVTGAPVRLCCIAGSFISPDYSIAAV